MSVIGWVVIAFFFLAGCLAIYDWLRPPWSLRASLYKWELITGVPFGWVLVSFFALGAAAISSVACAQMSMTLM